LAYVDENRRTLLTQFHNVAEFDKDFVIGPDLFKGLERSAEQESIEIDPADKIRSKDLIALRLKALIARDLWDTSAYWQVINTDNPVDRSFQRAIEALTDNTFQKLGMAKP
jgi:carboxyl-terminal processing protease